MTQTKRTWKLAAVLVAALALAGALLTGCSGNSNSSSANYRTLDQIKDSGKITIGVFSDKSPFGYVDENGNYQGYDIELANRLGQDLGVDVELVSTEAANRVEYLQTGKVDVILANFTVTPERAEAVDFADPYMNVALGVVSHKDKVVTDLDQIGDRTVIVISGTTAETYLTEHNKDLKLEKYDTYAAAKTAFENNPDAVWANDNTEVIAFANQAGPEYVVGIEQLGDTDTIAPAVSKGNESLLNWINEDLKNLGAENFNAVALSRLVSPIHARIDGADGDIAQLSLDANALNVRLTSAEGNVAALEQTVSDQGARIALVADADGVNAASIVAAINNGGSSVTLSADKIDLNGITTVADTLHIGSENSLERKYLIFHKSGAVISATRGDVPELKLSAGKIDLCGTLYHNGQPLDL